MCVYMYACKRMLVHVCEYMYLRLSYHLQALSYISGMQRYKPCDVGRDQETVLSLCPASVATEFRPVHVHVGSG